MENCEIYITGIGYQVPNFSPDDLIQQLFDNFGEIQCLNFNSISLNMSQVYNVSLKQSNYESMIVFLKGVKYFHKEFLTLDEVHLLNDKIKARLGCIDHFTYMNIEFRTLKNYSDVELGLCEVVKRSAPTIIQNH